MRRKGLEGILARFEINSRGCWEWTGSLSAKGYAVATVEGRYVRVHRYVYEKLVGPIPVGLEPDHLCRNHKCINPDHLELVTHLENLERGNWSRGKRKQYERRDSCRRGHLFDEVNTYVTKTGARICRECQRQRYRRRYRRVKEQRNTTD